MGASGDCYVCSIWESHHDFVTEIASKFTGISQEAIMTYLGGMVRRAGRGFWLPFPPPFFRVLPGGVFPDGYAVFAGEGEKVVPVYPVLSPGQPERRQVALLDPAQDGHFTDAAMPGNDTGGQIFGVCPGSDYSQVLASFFPAALGLCACAFDRLSFPEM
jgi:hypothetical protein